MKSEARYYLFWDTPRHHTWTQSAPQAICKILQVANGSKLSKAKTTDVRHRAYDAHINWHKENFQEQTSKGDPPRHALAHAVEDDMGGCATTVGKFLFLRSWRHYSQRTHRK